MTRVDFYILPEAAEEDRFQFACRLVEKAARQGHRIYLHTRDSAAAQLLDEQLWAFRPDSFVPHQLLDDKQQAQIEIGCDTDPQHQHDLLVNLDHEVPLFFSRFERVAEIVVQDDEVIQATRKHYAFYKERGYPLHNHDMRK